MKRLALAFGLGAVAVGGMIVPGSASAGPRAAFPSTPAVTNPYLPMQPGVSLIYDGIIYGGKGGTAQKEHDVVLTTTKVKMITGIPCVVQQDTGWVNGKVEEITYDYFAQDSAGNVWYMGEYATQYKKGQPAGHAGSWQAGKNGALGGIVMEAAPRPGDTYLQENYPGQALDSATVLSTTSSVSVPFGTWINNVLLTKEFSPLEPGQAEHKYYEPGIGNVRAVQVQGLPNEYLNLTGIQYPAT